MKIHKKHTGEFASKASAMAFAMGWFWLLVAPASAVEVVGEVIDADSKKPIPARIYIQDRDGNWRFVESASSRGSAVPYREQWVPTPGAVEKHTTISAHPFRIDLQPGKYQVTIERGKEYLPLTRSMVVGQSRLEQTFPLKRWVNLASRGWYSGETHVHRRIEELPNVMLAEDLNVAFPVTFWTTDAFTAPGLDPSPLRRQGPSPFGARADRGHQMIPIDPSHVIFPRNTEYEVFNIRGQRHTLGAVFILNHKSVFAEGMPPVGKIAEQAHREGALLDLDKHSWPWAMMLVPVAKIDLFELANNSVWRTNFGFRRSATILPEYMDIESEDGRLTEWGWLNFGFENYYALLNCGFRLQVTAGTASGVHPVPLGYSRVYVHTGQHFDADRWFDGLRQGRSFVTTGPMLFATINDKLPGHVFRQSDPRKRTYEIKVESISARPLDRIEIVINGRIWKTLKPDSDMTARDDGGYHFQRQDSIEIDRSSWIAVRGFQYETDRRVRFAHTAPWHIEIDGQMVRPRRVEIDFLIGRVRDEIKRNEAVLPDVALDEFREALRRYEEIQQTARD